MIKVDIIMGEGSVVLGSGKRTRNGSLLGYFVSFSGSDKTRPVGEVVDYEEAKSPHIRLLVKNKETLDSLRESFNGALDALEGVITETVEVTKTEMESEK